MIANLPLSFGPDTDYKGVGDQIWNMITGWVADAGDRVEMVFHADWPIDTDAFIAQFYAQQDAGTVFEVREIGLADRRIGGGDDEGNQVRAIGDHEIVMAGVVPPAIGAVGIAGIVAMVMRALALLGVSGAVVAVTHDELTAEPGEASALDRITGAISGRIIWPLVLLVFLYYVTKGKKS